MKVSQKKWEFLQQILGLSILMGYFRDLFLEKCVQTIFHLRNPNDFTLSIKEINSLWPVRKYLHSLTLAEDDEGCDILQFFKRVHKNPRIPHVLVLHLCGLSNEPLFSQLIWYNRSVKTKRSMRADRCQLCCGVMESELHWWAEN